MTSSSSSRGHGIVGLDQRWQGVFIDDHGVDHRVEFFIVDVSPDTVQGRLYKTCTLPSKRVRISRWDPPRPHEPRIISNPPHPS